MRKLKLLITAIFTLFLFQEQNAQSIIELPYKSLNQEFITFTETLKEVYKTDSLKYIELCNKALDKFEDKDIRYQLIYWKLSFQYANLKQYDKCFEILKKGQGEGLFYYLRTGNRVFPPYLKELEKLDGYEAFLEKNNALKEEAARTSKTEYMIQLPKSYNENTKYPLMLILHGGIGNITGMQNNYISTKLDSDFIVAYFQGAKIVGSSSRRFSMEDWTEKIVEGYEQIASKYPIDTTKIILAGPSAGGYRSLILGLNNQIPAKGLLLSFTVYPRELDSTLFIKSAERGLKISMLCGENDWAIQQQKKLGYLLDKYGINNRFVVFPEEGHDFPENWPYYLDTSLEFILKEN
jgi:dienelactone hydrolase